jgi:Holliday junction resolvase
MSGRSSRTKGSKIEREVVHLHRDLGIDAHRVPLSGAVTGYKGDVLIKHNDRNLVAEVKARGSGAGFVTLERWLGEHDMLFLRRDRAKPMVLLPWGTYVRLLKGEGEA